MAVRFKSLFADPHKVPNVIRSPVRKLALFIRRLAAKLRQIFGREATASDILTALERGAYQRGHPKVLSSTLRAGSDFSRSPATDVTPQGEQRVIPGAEKITDRELIERKAEGPAPVPKFL